VTNRSPLKSICVYCGSSDNGPATHRELARDLGRRMAANGIQLIYGGGRVGVMGAVANAVLDASGTVTGVIPDFLMQREHGHHDVTNLEVVANMHERKARMAELSDAFIVLPGGLGTLEELFEIMTWRQLGLHDKPIMVINPDGHWDHLKTLIGDLVTAGYARPENAGLAHFVADPATALSTIEAQFTGETHIETGRL
jgi:uncharacterized protein (TIGR00730 family)